MLFSYLPLALASFTAEVVLAQSPPSQLWSSIVPKKIKAAYDSVTTDRPYPQWTGIKTDVGDWQLFPADTWTSGFFPSTLYALNARLSMCGATESNGLGQADWLKLARTNSASLASLTKSNTVGHDVGFLAFPFMDELRVDSSNEEARNVVIGYADFLANRFSPTVGCTRSWDSDAPKFQVIIDNMMNLELLMVASELTGDSHYSDIAHSHAKTTMVNHIRDDGSTWHVIEYNENTGAVMDKRTAQGYSDDSTWTRGQSWGIYGFANMYKWFGDDDFLKTARRLADFYLTHIPKDGVIPWDFNAPIAGRPADSSAAMLSVVGLLMLSDVETDSSNADKYEKAALNILNKNTEFAWNEGWESLLSNGTVSKPVDSFNTGIVYGDYYFVVAGNTLLQMGISSCH
ncbi:glycoside hydrolase family 88 protein [Cylindrobasidium torrendii FP15055 ss-10]|uniref:Glycoside hydrolase family 88 protein n=1 Tax=Cylindrobasidium torrendii FP15055 ss-10 TaxID=1314674 RepID=A0A0D7AZN1_9AGAR|nr:glycoside hydrolase family 88 protein [Cylindrobasidium torrendii FP15055 ss-10]